MLPQPRPNTTPKFRIFDSSQPPLPASSSPFKRDAWAALLHHYPGPLPQLLYGALTYGVQIGYTGPYCLLLSRNHGTAYKDCATISSKLQADLLTRRVALATPTYPFLSSPIGLVPKHDGGWR
jgi:hypothetical protein